MRAHKAVRFRYFKKQQQKKPNGGVTGIKIMALLHIPVSAHCTNTALPAQGVQLYMLIK